MLSSSLLGGGGAAVEVGGVVGMGGEVVVFRVDARDAHLELVGIGRVVQRFFLCVMSRD